MNDSPPLPHELMKTPPPMTKAERRQVRRAHLENKFVRLIGHADHPLIALAKQAPAGLTKGQARRWARNRMKKARARR